MAERGTQGWRWVQTLVFVGAAVALILVLAQSFAVQGNLSERQRQTAALVTATAQAGATQTAAAGLPATARAGTRAAVGRTFTAQAVAWSTAKIPILASTATVRAVRLATGQVVARASATARVIVTQEAIVRSTRMAERFELLRKADRWGHGEVGGISWSPYSSLLALATFDGVELCDSQTLETVRLLSSTSPLASVTFSPNGRFLAARPRHEEEPALIWDTTSWQPLSLSITGTTDLAFAADSSFLAVIRLDKGIAFYRLPSGQERRRWAIDDSPRFQIALSPDGALVATAGDGGAVLWDSETGQVAHELQPLPEYVGDIAFTPDGRFLVAVDSHDEGLVVWDASTGALEWWRYDLGRVWALAIAPDGVVMAVGMRDGWIALLGAATRGDIGRIQGHEDDVSDLTFSPDGRYLASVGYMDGEVRIWGIRP